MSSAESFEPRSPRPGACRRCASRIILLLAIILAFGLGTYHLAAQSLWYDEAVTAQVAARGVAELTRWTADDIQPPLYYYIEAGWTRLVGRSEWALRFPSACFAVLLVATLAALARRLFPGSHGHLAGVAAAALAAASPLYVYYAQEARMYTLLTFLGALAGYLLLRALEPGAGRRALYWWGAFVVAATAMLYTHYFGFFLLLAYGLYVLLCCRSWRGLGLAALAMVAVMLLYLPWLPAMQNRYLVDRSYWAGALKLDEALRHLAISFVAGAPETALEGSAARWLPWFAGAFVVCGAALIGARPSLPGRPRGLLFLSLWLVVPVAGVLALAARTPKFNPRYLMLASPAFMLWLAGGIGALMAGRGGLPSRQAEHQTPLLSSRAGVQEVGLPPRPAEEPGTGSPAPRSWLLVSRSWFSDPAGRGARLVLALGVLALAGSVAARDLANWFTDPAFDKAQWKQAAAYVRREMGPNEAVVLVSGHAAPAWDYYAPDLPPLRLPDIDVLDVQAVLGYSVGQTLAKALAGKAGVWVVLWQDDVADPVGFVPYFLDRAGSELPQPGQFAQLRLRHWSLRPDGEYAARPAPQHALGADYSHKIELLGWDDPQKGQLTVYWQALNTLAPHDYQVSLIWEDAAGHPAGPRWDGRPAGYLYPTDRWRPGEPLFGQYPLPSGLPPGRYYVTVALYDAGAPSGLDIMDVADNPAGKRVRLGPIAMGG